VNFDKPGPAKRPSTFCAPWAIKTAASASRNGNGAHDEDVDIILLNIAANPFRRRTWKSAQDIKEARKKGQSRKAKSKGEEVKGKRAKRLVRHTLDPLGSGQVAHEPSGYGWFGLGPDQAIDKLAVFENQHGGNALNLELRRRARVFIDIQLGDAISAV
jgi:hypothetical protein